MSKEYKPTHKRFDFFDKYNEEYFENLIPDDFLCMKEITGRQIKDSLHELLERLRKLHQTSENYGMVHFDYSDGNYNIEYDTGKINVFDFDNCRTCWYMFDIANLWSHGLGWIVWNDNADERRAYMDSYNSGGKKRVYSGKYALSSIVFCGHCGDIYRRIKWNNRGCKSTVWRCVSRVEKGGPDCPARTISIYPAHLGYFPSPGRVNIKKRTM